jgi:hypothetical protein
LRKYLSQQSDGHVSLPSILKQSYTDPMDTSELLSAVSFEIAALQQARALLSGKADHFRRGSRSTSGAKRRTMSATARARIGAATKARWAAGKMGKQSRNRLKKKAAKKAA